MCYLFTSFGVKPSKHPQCFTTMATRLQPANASSIRTNDSDPRCVPIKLAASIPIGDRIAYPDYTAEEHAVWRELFERQSRLLPGRAADEFLSGLEALDLDRKRIPTLAGVSGRLERATGWRVARTPGLLDAHDFFSHLAQRVFPCTDYIRSRQELDYTPAPDCFHDIFGHTPMIMHPRFADFYQRIGATALACKNPGLEEGLTRIYWFTVEFGLVKNRRGLRIFGNGILSSFGETQHSLTDKVTRRPFDPDVVAATPYDIWHFQDTLFVIESFDHLADAFDAWVKHNIGAGANAA
jgi:phenylalanine-4-hydroxylase